MILAELCSVSAVPSAPCLVVELGRSSLDLLELIVSTSPLEGVVPGVGLQHGLQLLGGCSRSLSEDGLLDRLVAKVIHTGVDDASDGRSVGVNAEVPQPFVRLRCRCLK